VLAGFAGFDTRGVASETRSAVSTQDLRSGKYRNVAIFIEGVGEPERSAAEQSVISTLQAAGLNPASAVTLFAERGNLTEQAKANIVQKEFDSVLYWTIVQKGVVEELVPNARSDGRFLISNLGMVNFGEDLPAGYTVKPDGSVYRPQLALKTKVDLQDAKTAKQVWTSETVSSGNPKVANMNALLGQASQQIVEKMKSDGVI
jgi:hypothetical protein